MAQPAHIHSTHPTTTTHTHDGSNDLHRDKDGNTKQASKMHATTEKFVGGIKETIGTVAHAEGLKEAGREQKREGDAEALAATKGKKHYDPALARKGVGIQHKHMGPNPKKFTEGPCAGCKEGTCQVGHDYDAAICHSVTQGHADAGHVKSAGMGTDPRVLHGDGVMRQGACCSNAACTTSVPCSNCAGTGHLATTTAAPVVIDNHNRDIGTTGHVKKSKHKNRDKKLKYRAAKKSEMDRAIHRVDPDYRRDLEKEDKTDKARVAELDLQDQRDMEKLHPNLHRCDHSDYKRKHNLTASNYMQTNNGVHYCDVCDQPISTW